MLTDIKYLKYIKLLCWSNKVKVGRAVFMTTRSVFLLLDGANLIWRSYIVFGCLYYAL